MKAPNGVANAAPQTLQRRRPSCNGAVQALAKCKIFRGNKIESADLMIGEKKEIKRKHQNPGKTKIHGNLNKVEKAPGQQGTEELKKSPFKHHIRGPPRQHPKIILALAAAIMIHAGCWNWERYNCTQGSYQHFKLKCFARRRPRQHNRSDRSMLLLISLRAQQISQRTILTNLYHSSHSN